MYAQVVLGLGELFAYWSALYFIAGSTFGTWMITLTSWAERMIKEFEGREQ